MQCSAVAIWPSENAGYGALCCADSGMASPVSSDGGRKLARRHSSPRPIVVERQYVIEGGLVKKKMALPTVDIPGVDEACVQIAATTSWVHQVLEGKCRDGQLAAKIAAWITKVKTIIESSFKKRARNDVNREALGLSDPESDDEPARKKPRVLPKLVLIEVDGHSFNASLLRRIAYVAASTEDLGAALASVQEAKPTPEDERKKAQWVKDRAAQDVGEAEQGKICWNFSRRCWQVSHLGEDGLVHRVTKDLSPPSKNFAGDALSPKEFAQAKLQFLQKARRSWNELDKSGEARFEVD